MSNQTHFVGGINMKTVNKIVKIVAKILEIAHWVGAALLTAAAICTAAAPQALGFFVNMSAVEKQGEISSYGFEVSLLNAAGEVNMTTLRMFAIGAILIFILVAMIFRNIYLIIKKSENTTPFQKDNVRMVREIGIFSIAIPVIALIMSIIIRLVVGVEAIETSVNLDGFVMGLIILSLTQVFAYGADLEKDVDGLL